MLDTIHRDEDQLIEKAISGEKEAFGHLYDQYFPQIFKYLLVRTDTREDAEDMTETVFIKAWEHLPNFGGKTKERNLRAWLFRIAHNTVVDHYRTNLYRWNRSHKQAALQASPIGLPWITKIAE